MGRFQRWFFLYDGDGSFLFSALTPQWDTTPHAPSLGGYSKSWGQFQMPATRGRIKRVVISDGDVIKDGGVINGCKS